MYIVNLFFLIKSNKILGKQSKEYQEKGIKTYRVNNRNPITDGETYKERKIKAIEKNVNIFNYELKNLLFFLINNLAFIWIAKCLGKKSVFTSR